MITRKIIISDFHLSLCKSCLIDVFKMLVWTILYGQQASFRIYWTQAPGCLKQQQQQQQRWPAYGDGH